VVKLAVDLSLEPKVAIITGGAGGMGSVMTLALIGDGARVVAIDTSQDRLDALATKAATIGGEGSFLGLRADITLVEECERIVDAVLTRFSAVNILVNAAGIGMQTIRANYMKEPVRFWEIDPERWQKLMDVNWKGAYLMARAVTPHLLRQGWGRIVNVTTSLDTMYRGNYTPYGMSKAALEAATVSWSEDLKGSGVTVNVLVPGGPTNTSFIPQGAPFDRAAMVQPEVMAAPIHWLASPASDRVTGCRIVARDWDVRLAADEAAKAACAPAAWQDVKTKAFWPGKS
jgi:3-oxoacyl-[acyl-carrier protein] reductase